MANGFLVFGSGDGLAQTRITCFPREARQRRGFIDLGRDRQSLPLQTGYQLPQVVRVLECPTMMSVNCLQCLFRCLLGMEAQVLVQGAVRKL